MIKLPPKAAILLWYGLDSSLLAKDNDLAYAVITLDRALEAQIPDWSTWEVIEIPIENIIREIQDQRVRAGSLSCDFDNDIYDGWISIPWTPEQLDALIGAIK